VNSKKLLCITCLMFLVLGLAATLWAQNAAYNRPMPTMDYVPQEIAIYDGMYNDQNESTCRKCHGNSTADRHHGTPMVVRDNLCLPCHPICTIGVDPDCENGITIHRDCLTTDCHSWADVQFGNGKWHHNTDMAESENCIACHDQQYIEEITPFRSHELYPPSVVTPTPFSCENCHWEQPASVTGDPNAPGHPSTYEHKDYWGNLVGFYEYGKPISNNIDTHHMDFVGEVASECYKCHSQDPGNPSWDPNNPELIRYCEICHSIRSLHVIAPHVSDHNGWLPVGFHANPGNPVVRGGGGPGPNPTIYAKWGPTPYTPQQNPGFTGDEQCWGCHGAEVEPWIDEGIGAPTIDIALEGIMPTMGSCGALVAIRGTNFGEEHIAGREVQIRLGPPDPWQTLPIHAWTNTYIEVEIPCWQFAPGNYKIRVKSDGGVSNQRVFRIHDSPTLLAVTDSVGDPDSGTCGSWLRLTGSGGFNTTRNSMATDNYHGLTHIVDFVASSGEYTATVYGAGLTGTIWTDTAIDVRLWNLFRDGGGGNPPFGQPDECSIDPITGQKRMERNFVQDIGDENASSTITCDNASPVYDECAAEPTIARCDCLSTGVFQIYVKAIYYGDDDLSGTLTCGDTIFEVEKSDPVQYELINSPVINKLNPKQITDPVAAPFPLLKIYGANFNPTQTDGSVRISTKANCTSATLGLGVQLNNIKLWSDTLIKVRVNAPNAWQGTTKYVWVERPGALVPKSNCKPLAILAP
jgi:hypothetical protein